MITEEQSPKTEEVISPETTPQIQTPTAEEQLKTLRIELDQTKSERQRVEDSYKGLQRTLNKTNEELKRQSDLKGELAELRETQKLQAALMAEAFNRPEESLNEDVQTRKPDLLKRYTEESEKIAASRKTREIEQQRLEYNRQADEVWTKASKLGLPETDDNLLDIEDYLKSGNIKRAEARITKLEAEKKPVAKVESDEERINRLVEERLKKTFQEKGLLETDTAVPSGRTGSREDVIRRYAEGDSSVSESDFLKATGRG